MTGRRDVIISSHHTLRSETVELVMSLRTALELGELNAGFGRTYAQNPKTLQRAEKLIDAWTAHLSALQSTNWDSDVNPAAALIDWRAIPFTVIWCGLLYVAPATALLTISGALFGGALAWSSILTDDQDERESVPAQLIRECQRHIDELPPLLHLLRQQQPPGEFPSAQVLAQCELLVNMKRS